MITNSNSPPPRHWNIGVPGQVVLVFQGGGALGAYQAGVYHAMHEAAIEPNWIIGTSIGAINGALTVGNRREDRVAALKAFWRQLTTRPSRLFDHADAITNAARGDIAADLRLAARACDKFASLRFEVAEIAAKGRVQQPCLLAVGSR
jgi:predicted acylesterase/phospholipase RssA